MSVFEHQNNMDAIELTKGKSRKNTAKRGEPYGL